MNNTESRCDRYWCDDERNTYWPLKNDCDHPDESLKPIHVMCKEINKYLYDCSVHYDSSQCVSYYYEPISNLHYGCLNEEEVEEEVELEEEEEEDDDYYIYEFNKDLIDKTNTFSNT